MYIDVEVVLYSFVIVHLHDSWKLDPVSYSNRSSVNRRSSGFDRPGTRNDLPYQAKSTNALDKSTSWTVEIRYCK